MAHDIHSGLLLLPSDLKHSIAELLSHDSLASLARTHTAYQREAEQALYRTLSDPSLNCLETLATNSEKAGFVRFLIIECLHENDNQRAKSYLLNALVNMHSLSDFRLRMSESYGVQSWIESLDKILCNVHFRLQTLYCDEVLDLSRIIRSQTELQILGIYMTYDIYDKVRFLGTIKRLQNAQLHIPVVVTLDSIRFPVFDQISIFPAFYPIDRHPTIHQVLAESFDQGSKMLADTSGVFSLSIYLVDSCDMPSIHMLAKNMTMTFPEIMWLTFCFENPCEIPSQEVKKIVSLLPKLRHLKFRLWAHHNVDGEIPEDGKNPEDIMMAHVKDWELACPKLYSVSFIDGSSLWKRARGFWESESFY